jgi:hypothetical protein
VDGVGKGVVLRSALNQARKAAKKGTLTRDFGDVLNRQELKMMQKWLGGNTAVKDMPLQVQKVVEEMAFTKLGQQQLISIAGRPLAYAHHPNARVMYALSGFAVKQLAMIRRNVFHEIKKGNHGKAASYAARYVAFSGVGYGLIDETRRAGLGEDFEPEDVLWGVLDQLGAVMTLNRVGDVYALNKLAEDPMEYLLTSLVPPLGLPGALAQDAGNMILKGEYNAKLAERFPVLGDFYKYYWKDKDKKERPSKGDQYRQFIDNWGED